MSYAQITSLNNQATLLAGRVTTLETTPLHSVIRHDAGSYDTSFSTTVDIPGRFISLGCAIWIAVNPPSQTSAKEYQGGAPYTAFTIQRLAGKVRISTPKIYAYGCYGSLVHFWIKCDLRQPAIAE